MSCPEGRVRDRCAVASSSSTADAMPVSPAIAKQWRPWSGGSRCLPSLWRPAPDPPAVRQLSTSAPMARSSRNHGRDAIRLLDPQLRGVAHFRSSSTDAMAIAIRGSSSIRSPHLAAADRTDRSGFPPRRHLADGLRAAHACHSRLVSTPIRCSSRRAPAGSGSGQHRPSSAPRPGGGPRPPARPMLPTGPREPRARTGSAFARAGHRVLPPSRWIGTPMKASIRSVWSRVGPGVSMAVSPLALRRPGLRRPAAARWRPANDGWSD